MTYTIDEIKALLAAATPAELIAVAPTIIKDLVEEVERLKGKTVFALMDRYERDALFEIYTTKERAQKEVGDSDYLVVVEMDVKND